ncbi:MAG TPA: cupin domain-containing protein [Gammaproteobacteria bacterium]|nr:cupin domain-containing protein [Gammaproteobacteria bacterium]
MTAPANNCRFADQVDAYALGALTPSEKAGVEAHLVTCEGCRRALAALAPVVNSFSSWPTDVLRPSPSLWNRLAERIGIDANAREPASSAQSWNEPEWDNVAPGIWCQLLATDTERHRVSMLVRLEPGGVYPPHQHAGVEELHLLDGELWIEDRKLYPGDYNRGEAGTGDERVYSETGCTCVLVTSTLDKLQ